MRVRIVVLSEAKDLTERPEHTGANARSFAALQGGDYPARDDKSYVARSLRDNQKTSPSLSSVSSHRKGSLG